MNYILKGTVVYSCIPYILHVVVWEYSITETQCTLQCQRLTVQRIFLPFAKKQAKEIASDVSWRTWGYMGDSTHEKTDPWHHRDRQGKVSQHVSMQTVFCHTYLPATDPFHSSLWWRGERERGSCQLMLEAEAHAPHFSLALWTTGCIAYANKLK